MYIPSFFSLISGAHHSFRVLEDVVGSSRVKSTSRASVPLCVDEVPTLADSSGVATRFSNRNWRSFLFFFFNKILFRSKEDIEKEEIFEISLIIVRRQHFFFRGEKSSTDNLHPIHSNIDPHSVSAQKRNHLCLPGTMPLRLSMPPFDSGSVEANSSIKSP